MKAMLEWVSMWSKRTLILLVYGTQMGYATDHGNRESVTAQKFDKGGPAAAETGDNPTMKQMKEDVKAMYKKAKNTLHLSLLLHLDEDLQLWCMRILKTILPLHTWQRYWLANLRSRPACRRFLSSMAIGTAVFPHLLEIMDIFSDTKALAHLGLVTERLVSTSWYKNMPLDDPEVMAEQEKVMKLSELADEVLSTRLRSCGENMWSYPNIFYRLAVSDIEWDEQLYVVKEVLIKMKRLYTAVKIVLGGQLATTPFYAMMLQDSQLNYVAVDEMFEWAASFDFGEAALPEMRHTAVRDSSGIGHTGLVEESFRDDRDLGTGCPYLALGQGDMWMNAVPKKILSREDANSEVTTDGQPESSPKEEEVKVNSKMFLPEFAKKSLPFNVVVSAKKDAPYASFTPESSAEQYEMNELLEELGQGGEDLLAQGPACWRTRFVTKGLVVRYKRSPKELYYSTGGKWSSRLWPLVETQSANGVPHWCLKRIEHTSEIEWRTLSKFDDVEV